MFFPEKINISKDEKVLEIGPGGSPFYRSNILFDRFYGNTEALRQSGGTGIKTADKPLIISEDPILPFFDKSFDYIICSHVLEHIPVDEIELFVSELIRTGKRYYIEFPSIFYEYLFDITEHKTILFIDSKKNIIYCLNKNKFPVFTNISHKSIFTSFKNFLSQRNVVLGRFILAYKRYFFIGHEFDSDFAIKIVNSIDEIPGELFPNPKLSLIRDCFNLIKFKCKSYFPYHINSDYLNNKLCCPKCNKSSLKNILGGYKCEVCDYKIKKV